MSAEAKYKYKVDKPYRLASWDKIARREIYRWLTDEAYEKEVITTTMTTESIGPFTKFLYHFATLCECGWGVMIDFNERRQRVFLTDRYYKWMHKLRDEIESVLEDIDPYNMKSTNLFPDDKSSGAIFSADKKHRLKLWRTWDDALPKLMFIGLNPSTANETDNDPTIKSCIRIAKHNGYGGIIMMNCWTHISTDPDKLRTGEPSLSETGWLLSNDDSLLFTATNADVCFAWGNFKIVRDTSRDKELSRMLPNSWCLGKNKNGSPKHPLYCKTETKLIPY